MPQQLCHVYGGSVIQTKRLRIVPFSEEYLTEQYVNWLNDPEVVRFSENRHRPHTVESCRQYLHSFGGTDNRFWAVLRAEAGLEHIGNMNAYVDKANQLADVGILIGEKSCWGKGYGLEAWLGVCDYLFRQAGMRKVSAGALCTNRSMLSIMHRAGMVEDGRRRRHCMVGEEEVDLVHAAVFRETWMGTTMRCR
jgi:ribosomal-protein-alanine N-acetyltransferase